MPGDLPPEMILLHKKWILTAIASHQHHTVMVTLMPIYMSALLCIHVCRRVMHYYFLFIPLKYAKIWGNMLFLAFLPTSSLLAIAPTPSLVCSFMLVTGLKKKKIPNLSWSLTLLSLLHFASEKVMQD